MGKKDWSEWQISPDSFYPHNKKKHLYDRSMTVIDLVVRRHQKYIHHQNNQ